jgi:hypothetical protein
MDTLFALAIIAVGLWLARKCWRTLTQDILKTSGIAATVGFACALWLSLFFTEKIISWHIWRGQGLAYGHGGDKETLNFVLEPILVGTLAMALSVGARRLAGPRYSRWMAMAVGLGTAASVVVAVPPLGH